MVRSVNRAAPPPTVSPRVPETVRFGTDDLPYFLYRFIGQEIRHGLPLNVAQKPCSPNDADDSPRGRIVADGRMDANIEDVARHECG